MTPSAHQPAPAASAAVLETVAANGATGGTSHHRGPGAPRGRRALAVTVGLQLLAMVGIGALIYPNAADWFSALTHNSEISGYTASVDQLSPRERSAALDLARAYNAQMPQGVLRDPYSAPQDAEQNEAYSLYSEILRVNGTGVIGELTYPNIGVSLPVYHGTSEEVLRKGVGHLYGSSLPIGGPSTHAVMTSHSGLINASLFTRLPDAKLGDTFTMQVLGETHWYRVDRIEAIRPEDTQALQIVAGKDLVTLITCTPIGINSHRLLVTGSRIAAPASGGEQAIAGDGRTAGFPWWALVFTGGSGAAAWLLFAPPGRRRDRETRNPEVPA